MLARWGWGCAAAACVLLAAQVAAAGALGVSGSLGVVTAGDDAEVFADGGQDTTTSTPPGSRRLNAVSTLTADYFFFNREFGLSEIGYSVAQHEGVVAYGQLNFGHLSASMFNIQEGIGSKDIDGDYLTGSNERLRVAVGSDYAAAATAAIVHIFRLERITSTSMVWHDDGSVTTPLLTPAGASPDTAAIIVTTVAVDGVRDDRAPQVLAVAFTLSTVPTVAVFERVAASVCDEPGSVCAAAGDGTDAAWLRVAIVTAADASHRCGNAATALAVLTPVVAIGCPGNNTVVLWRRARPLPGTDVSAPQPWRFDSAVAITAASENSTLTGGERFGEAVELTWRHLMVGGPGANAFAHVRAPDVGSGSVAGGAAWVFPSPLRDAAAVAASLTPASGPQPPPFATPARVCRVAGAATEGALGTAVASDSWYSDTLLFTSAPLDNKVLTVLVHEPGVEDFGFTGPADALTGDAMCELRHRLTGFRMTSEIDVGVSTAFYGEMTYFGSPSADNAAVSANGNIGRLYVKGYCFPNRFALGDADNAVIVRCYNCPRGMTAPGGVSGAAQCAACPNAADKPELAEWGAGAGCVWACAEGAFGPRCLRCAAYRDATGDTQTLLPPDASWVDEEPACVWQCNPGFTPAPGTPSPEELAALPLHGLPAVDPNATYCLPPPVPDAVRHVLAFNSTATASTLAAVFYEPDHVPQADLLALRVNVTGTSHENGEVVRSVADLPYATAATPASVNATRALADIVADDLGGLPNYDRPALQVVVTGLLASTAYTARLAVSNAGGFAPTGGASPVVVTLPPELPSQPGIVTAVGASGSTLWLEWRPPTDLGGRPQTAYLLCDNLMMDDSLAARDLWLAAPGNASGCDAVYTAATDAASHVVTGLTAATAHWMWVAVATVVGTSQPSDLAPVATGPPSPPSPPRNLTCVALSGSRLDVSWLPPADLGGGPVRYMVLWAADAATPPADMARTEPMPPSATTTVVTGLTALTTYHLFVQGSTGGVDGELAPADGVPAACTAGPAAPPSAPVVTNAVAASPSMLLVSWTPPDDNGGAAVLAYTVQASPSVGPGVGHGSSLIVATAAAGGSLPPDAAVTDLKLPDLFGDTTYLVTVSATNTAGQGAASGAYAYTTPPAVAPSAVPPPLELVATGGALTMSWEEPEDSGGSPLTHYTVYVSQDTLTFDVAAVVPPTDTVYTLGRLLPDHPYFVFVVAANGVGDSHATGVVSSFRTTTATPPGVMAPPRAHTPSPSSAVVTWAAPLDTGGLSITAYVVQFDSGAHVGEVTVPVAAVVPPPGAPADNATVATGLLADSVYRFRVAAVNDAGTGPSSLLSDGAVATLPAAPPTPPRWVQPVECEATASQVTVAWQPPADSGGDPVVRYTVFWSTDNATSAAGAPTAHNATLAADADASLVQATLSGLTAATPYFVAVSAANAAGASALALGTAPFVTVNATAPSPVRGMSVAPGDGNVTDSGVRVSWLPPVDTGGTPLVTYHVFLRLLGNSSRDAHAVDAADVPLLGGVTATTATSVVLHDVLPGMWYTARASASNAVGASVVSAPNGAPTAGTYVTFQAPVGDAPQPDLPLPLALLPSVQLGAVAPSAVEVQWAANATHPADWLVWWAAADASGAAAAPVPPDADVATASGAVAAGVAVAALRFPSGWTATAVNASAGSVWLRHSAANTTHALAVSSVAGSSRCNGSLPLPIAAATLPADPSVPPPAPGTPAVVLPGDGSVTVVWQPPADAAAASVASYVLQLTQADRNGTVVPSPPAVALPPVHVAPPGAHCPLAATTACGALQATVRGLPAGTYFVANVSAVTPWGSVSAATSGAAPGRTRLPAAPGALNPPAITSTGPSHAVVSWDPPADVDVRSYTLYLPAGDAPAQNDPVAALCADTEVVTVQAPASEVTVTGLRAATEYAFAVAARNVFGDGAVSAASAVGTTLPAVPPAPPGTPTVVSTTHSALVVSAPVPTDNGGAPVTAYRLNVSVVVTGYPDYPLPAAVTALTAATGAATVRLSASNLFASSQYTVVVSAANAAGWSQPSVSSAAITTGPAVQPSAPGRPAGHPLGGSSVHLTWTPPTDTGGTPVAMYRVQASRDGVFDDVQEVEVPVAPADSLATSYAVTFTGLLASTPYFFAVVAVSVPGGSGASPRSAASSVIITTDAQPPTPPIDVSASAVAASAVALRWQPPEDAGGRTDVCYTVSVAIDGATVDACAVPGFDVARGAWVGGVSPDAPQPTDAATAYQGLGLRFTLGGGHLALAPTGFAAAVTCTDALSVTLPVAANSVLRAVVVATTWGAADGTNGTTVRSMPLASNSSMGVVVFVPPGVPAAPATPLLAARDSSSVTPGWSAPLATGGCALAGMALFRRVPTSTVVVNGTAQPVWGDAVAVWGINATHPNASTDPSQLATWLDLPTPAQPFPMQYRDGGLRRATDLQYFLTATSGAGTSAPSPDFTIATLPALPTAPRDLAVVPEWVNPVTVGLAWQPPLDNGGLPVTSYSVLRSPGGAFNASAAQVLASVAGDVTEYNVSAVTDLGYDVQPNATYTFAVAAVTAKGQGPVSAAVEATTDPPVPCPADCSGNGVCAPWDGTCTCHPGFVTASCAQLDGVVLTTYLDAQPTAFVASRFIDAMAALLRQPAARFVVMLPLPSLRPFPPGSGDGSNGAARRRLQAASTPSAALVVRFMVRFEGTPAAGAVAANFTALAASDPVGVNALGIVGVAEGADPPPSAVVPVPNADCDARQLCTDCLQSAACGWCSATAQCTAGTATGPGLAAPVCEPPPGSGIPASGAPFYFHADASPSNATGSVCPAPCFAATTCAACAAVAECAWCDASGTCEPQAALVGEAATASCPVSAATGPLAVVTSEPECPAARCAALATHGTCVADPGCGWCRLGATAFCMAGDAFGPDDGATCPLAATGTTWCYDGSCADSCSAFSLCGDCTARANCGWCGTESWARCGVASPTGDGPRHTTCDGVWTPGGTSANPSCPPTLAEQCSQHAGDCLSCLAATAVVYDTLGQPSGTQPCSWCNNPPSNSPNAACAPNTAFHRAQCQTEPSMDTCIDLCPSRFSSDNRTGVIQLGSAGTPSDIRITYAERAACEWYLSPAIEVVSPDSPSEVQRVRFPIVKLSMQALDLAVGDSVEVYADAGRTRLVGYYNGTGSVVSRGFSTLKTDTGQMLVKLRTNGDRDVGTGFRAVFGSAEQETVDIYFVAGVIVTSVMICFCCLCTVNRILARYRIPREFDVGNDDEGLEMGIANAQRTGRGAPRGLINCFPAYWFQKSQVELTPLKGLNPEDLQCSICLCDFDNGEKVRPLACRHAFHMDCIDQWLMLNRTCPLCKRDLGVMQAERLSLMDSPDGEDPLKLGPGVAVVDPEHPDGPAPALASAAASPPGAGAAAGVDLSRSPTGPVQPQSSTGLHAVVPVPGRGIVVSGGHAGAGGGGGAPGGTWARSRGSTPPEVLVAAAMEDAESKAGDDGRGRNSRARRLPPVSPPPPSPSRRRTTPDMRLPGAVARASPAGSTDSRAGQGTGGGAGGASSVTSDSVDSVPTVYDNPVHRIMSRRASSSTASPPGAGAATTSPGRRPIRAARREVPLTQDNPAHASRVTRAQFSPMLRRTGSLEYYRARGAAAPPGATGK